MRKLKYLFIALVLLLIPFAASAKGKVNVYIFRGEGCPHCEEALEFFDALSEDEDYKDLYELKTYGVWYDTENQQLMQDVADALGKEVGGVPFIVIGTDSFNGYAASLDDKIKTAIKDAYESDDYKDVVNEVAGGTYVAEKYKFPVVPVAIVAGVVILGVIGLVIFTGEKEETPVETKEVKEVAKEEKKPTQNKTKKSTTKKTNKK